MSQQQIPFTSFSNNVQNAYTAPQVAQMQQYGFSVEVIEENALKKLGLAPTPAPAAAAPVAPRQQQQQYQTGFGSATLDDNVLNGNNNNNSINMAGGPQPAMTTGYNPQLMNMSEGYQYPMMGGVPTYGHYHNIYCGNPMAFSPPYLTPPSSKPTPTHPWAYQNSNSSFFNATNNANPAVSGLQGYTVMPQQESGIQVDVSVDPLLFDVTNPETYDQFDWDSLENIPIPAEQENIWDTFLRGFTPVAQDDTQNSVFTLA